jgi:hypothetical protein
MAHITWTVDEDPKLTAAPGTSVFITLLTPSTHLPATCISDVRTFTHTRNTFISIMSQISVFFWHLSVPHVYISTEYYVCYNFVLLLLDRNIKKYKYL